MLCRGASRAEMLYIVQEVHSYWGDFENDPEAKRNLRMDLSRRDFLRLSGAGLGSAMLSGYLPGASVFAQDERILREPPPELLPKASSGGLEETELVVASMAGPDINAHVRNGERFTEYTQGKIQVRYDIIGRDVWNETNLTNMRAESDAWESLRFTLVPSGPVLALAGGRP